MVTLELRYLLPINWYWEVYLMDNPSHREVIQRVGDPMDPVNTLIHPKLEFIIQWYRIDTYLHPTPSHGSINLLLEWQPTMVYKRVGIWINMLQEKCKSRVRIGKGSITIHPSSSTPITSVTTHKYSGTLTTQIQHMMVAALNPEQKFKSTSVNSQGVKITTSKCTDTERDFFQ